VICEQVSRPHEPNPSLFFFLSHHNTTQHHHQNKKMNSVERAQRMYDMAHGLAVPQTRSDPMHGYYTTPQSQSAASPLGLHLDLYPPSLTTTTTTTTTTEFAPQRKRLGIYGTAASEHEARMARPSPSWPRTHARPRTNEVIELADSGEEGDEEEEDETRIRPKKKHRIVIQTRDGGAYAYGNREKRILREEMAWLNDTIMELYAHALVEDIPPEMIAVGMTVVYLPTRYFMYSVAPIDPPTTWNVNSQRFTIGFLSDSSHWSLIVIDSKWKKAHWFDSLQSIHEKPRVSSHIKKLTKDSGIQTLLYTVKRQKDGHACGLYALTNLKLFLACVLFCKEPEDIACYMWHVDIPQQLDFRQMIEQKIDTYAEKKKLEQVKET
jgi:hypothetical protein